jgi:putative oxidoreductase
MEDAMRNQAVWTDRGLLLLRVIVGIVFVMHGGQKLFIYGLPGVAAMLGSVGVPFPDVNAVLLTALELGGGLALIAGVATRVTAALVAFAMGVAVVTTHLAHGFFAPLGVEFPLTLLVTNLAFVLTGAGRYSVDALFGGSRSHQAAAVWHNAA